MNIVVFLKQVADNTKLKFNDSGPVLDGVPMMLNPFDEYALETAIRIKEAAGESAVLTAITIGAPTAKEILKKAIAVGVDQAFIINDSALDKVDSTPIAQTLAKATQSLVPEFSTLVFGQLTLDDASGQVGPKVAELLNLPSLSFVKEAQLTNNYLSVTREGDRGLEIHEMTLPGVLCVMKCDYELRGSNIKGVMKANKTDIPIKTLADIGLNAGSLTSTTTVTQTRQRPAKSGGKILTGVDSNTAVNELVGFLKSSKVI